MRRALARMGAGALAWGLLATTPAAGPADSPAAEAGPESEEARMLERVVELLSPPPEAAPPQAELWLTRLESWGSPALHATLAIRFGVVALPEEEVHPEALHLRPEVLAAHVERAAPSAWIPHARDLAVEHAEPAVRRSALRLLLGADSRDSFDAVLAVLDAVTARDLTSPSLKAVIADNVAARCRRFPDAPDFGAAAKRSELVPAFVQGLERSERGDVLSLLTDLLGSGTEGDRAVLAAVERRARERRAVPDDWTRATVREYLTHSEPSLRRAAASAVGALGDTDAVGDLIVRLGDSDERVATTAHRALVAVAGLDVGTVPDAWNNWLESERAWFDAEWPNLVHDLRGDDAHAAHAALRNAHGHPLRRDAVAGVVGPLLVRMEPDVSVTACGVLGRQRSPVAIAFLIDALDSSEERIRDAAHRALRELTGLALSPDAHAWKQAVARP